MRQYNPNECDIDNGIFPKRKSISKKVIIERRYVGDIRDELSILAKMYEDMREWHNFRRYSKISDAHKALECFDEPRYEYRIKR